ncbi:MAG: hypothetical protein EOO27_38300, partial [Comamonadaceae bacterium]
MMKRWGDAAIRSVHRARGVARALRSALVAVAILGGISHAWADAVWEFVDKDGVTHMGNVPPSAAPRGLVWLGGVPSAPGPKRSDRGTSPLNFRGYEDVRSHLEAAAAAQALEPAFVIAVAAAESAFNVKAVSRKGALGLMQV